MKHVFWAGPGSHSRELMVAATFIKPTQDQASQHSNMGGAGTHEAPPLAEEILVAAWGRIIFL